MKSQKVGNPIGLGYTAITEAAQRGGYLGADRDLAKIATGLLIDN